MSWLLKEERAAECLMSWGRLFQMWGPNKGNGRFLERLLFGTRNALE